MMAESLSVSVPVVRYDRKCFSFDIAGERWRDGVTAYAWVTDDGRHKETDFAVRAVVDMPDFVGGRFMREWSVRL